MVTVPYYFTETGYKKFVKKIEQSDEEITRLQSQSNISILNDGIGPDRDNSGFLQLQSQIADIKKRNGEQKKILSTAKIVSYTKNAEQKVLIGSTVYFLRNGIREKWIVGGFDESDPKNKIVSYDTPLGKELLGKKADEAFSFRNVTFKIIAVE